MNEIKFIITKKVWNIIPLSWNDISVNFKSIILFKICKRKREVKEFKTVVEDLVLYREKVNEEGYKLQNAYYSGKIKFGRFVAKTPEYQDDFNLNNVKNVKPSNLFNRINEIQKVDGRNYGK